MQSILCARFVGLYLDGSLVIGDFEPGRASPPGSWGHARDGAPESGYWIIHSRMLREHGVADAGPLRNGFYRWYAVLTMTSMLYKMRHGAIVSKPVATTWAAQALDPRWIALIRDARAWSRDAPPELNETLTYIRYTWECART